MNSSMYMWKYVQRRDEPPRTYAFEEERLKALNDQARPAADVARILDEAQVPNVLWGMMAICLVGEWNDDEDDVEFLVLDHLITAASNALVAAGFTPCTDPGCRAVQTEKNHHPIPAVHFHLKAQYPQHNMLRLYPKSGHLWWHPDFDLGPPTADDPDLMLSNDPRLPPYAVQGMSGPWTELYPIKILNRSSCTEAVWWLLFRDLDHANNYDLVWSMMIYSLMLYPKGITLCPKFQPMWEEFTLPERRLHAGNGAQHLDSGRR
ncbi:unnamed protein product [Penicillium egyptiacum]|uniref:Uncharacterized protein n=1 Tax=Penicillium egyptiacum TaxID=1303716 RepID=A0A9W4P645_9EURO|nr:unnamed protein product [Penicillium egyptiacum]